MEQEPTEERRQPRSRSDRRAESQVKKQQRSVETGIPYACFKRLARETLDKEVVQLPSARPFRFKPTGVKMLHEAAEALIVTHFGCALLSSRHKGRRGVMEDDMNLVSDMQRLLNHEAPLHMKPEPPSRRKRARTRTKPAKTNKKVRVTREDDALEKELEELLQPIEEEDDEAEEVEKSVSLEKEIEREPDSTDFQYEREELSDQY